MAKKLGNSNIIKLLIKASIEPVKSGKPKLVSPMLATLTDKAFDNENWQFELKWDGYRSLAYLNNGEVDLRSRENQPFNESYPTIVEALSNWKINAIVDGELVVVTKEGKADFEALQNWGNREEGTLVYYVFDLVWVEGFDLTKEPLTARRQILESLVPKDSIIKYSDGIDNVGTELYKLAEQNELEGIIGKRKDSIYTFGKRSKDWLKVVTEKRQEFVVGGWVESDSGRPFKSIVFGYYKAGKLHYFHHGGGGFKSREMPDLLRSFKDLEVKKSPFVNEVDYEGVLHWMKPQLVAEFKYSKVTKSGKIRHPAIFMGWRTDKKPKDITLDEPLRVEEVRTIPKHKERNVIAAADSNWPRLVRLPIKSEAMFDFDGKEVRLTNVEKELWAGVTKSDLIQYYHAIARYLLPHLKSRALSLHVKHRSPTAPGLYIKDMEGHAPDWAEVFTVPRKHKKKGKRDVIDYLVCNDEATLQYVVNLGCIDINPWTSRISDADHPDFIIIDLDPSDDDFSKAIETAKAAKQFFDEHRLKAFCKTSGKTGIHLFLPAQGFSFPQVRTIAETICKEVEKLVPDITTTDVMIDNRGNKLYIDPNQNDYADTVASAYSVRPFHLPTVSTPLEWKEVNSRLDSHEFTINSIIKRLEKKGDLFANVLSPAIQVKNSKLLINFL